MIKLKLEKYLLAAMMFLFFSLIPEYVSADDCQNKSQEVNYYVVLSEIGDYSGTLTLLKTYRELTPDWHYVYAIRDELEKEAMIAVADYFDWLIVAYAYRDEVAGKPQIIDAEEFKKYIKQIKVE
ncbi:MAG: hypothetical protein IKZ57_03225 [Spirochaetia bacterium]|nr:hypothetical protein [Spirochaetia bacterium]